jgi:hypothetical protein
MTDHEAEMDELLDQLARAGLTGTYVDPDGRQHVQLTADGERAPGRAISQLRLYSG